MPVGAGVGCCVGGMTGVCAETWLLVIGAGEGTGSDALVVLLPAAGKEASGN
jgi:hypothetical protein